MTRDVTMECWKILKISDHIARDGGRVTIGMLSDLVRGAGGGSYAAGSSKGKRKAASNPKVALDLENLVGGKVTMSKDVCSSRSNHLTKKH